MTNNKYITQHQLDKMFNEIEEFNKIDSRINVGMVCKNMLNISPSALINAQKDLYNISYKYYDLWKNKVKPEIQAKLDKYRNKDLEDIYDECICYLDKEENRNRIAKIIRVKPDTLRTLKYLPYDKISTGRILAIYDAIKGYQPYYEMPEEKHPTDRSFIYSKISEIVNSLVQKGFTKKDIGIGLFDDSTIIHQYTNLRKIIPRKKLMSIRNNYQKLENLDKVADLLDSKTLDDLINEYEGEEIIAFAKKHFEWKDVDELILNKSRALVKKRIFEVCCFIELSKRK